MTQGALYPFSLVYRNTNMNDPGALYSVSLVCRNTNMNDLEHAAIVLNEAEKNKLLSASVLCFWFQSWLDQMGYSHCRVEL